MTSKPTSQVCWLPALPDEGWASMDCYWRELQRCIADDSPAEFQIHSPAWLGLPPVQSAQSGVLKRFWRKRIVYPCRSHLERADLFHVLDHSYAHLIPHLRPGAKVVATVFDLVPLETDEGMTPAQVKRFRNAVECLRLADHLISISQETKTKLHSLLGILPERVTVAVPGMDFDRFQSPVPASNSVRERLRALPPAIFSVGTTVARKNLASLPAIFAEMKDDFRAKRCCFVRAGGRLPPRLKADLEAVIGPESFIELGPLFGQDLIAAFQSARALIFPSTLEGLTFVIPEAMAAGCPAVTNTMTANPEAGGDAALYYTEGDHRGAAAQLQSLLFDDDLHRERQRMSVERASQMTWRRHLRTVLDVYERVLHGSPPP